jgi:hypothetical protein
MMVGYPGLQVFPFFNDFCLKVLLFLDSLCGQSCVQPAENFRAEERTKESDHILVRSLKETSNTIEIHSLPNSQGFCKPKEERSSFRKWGVFSP